MQVRDVMTHGVIGVSESASVAEAVETMLRSRVSALLVFDAQHALTGILSEGDLFAGANSEASTSVPVGSNSCSAADRLAEVYAHEHGRKVGEVMTRDVETIDEDAELSEAVDRMIRRRIKRLPALRGDDVVGVISRSDLLKGLLAATPRANAPAFRRRDRGRDPDALDKLDWAPRASVQVEVANGVVTLAGAITDERLRDGLKVIAENTPGFVAVRDHMAWIEPNSGYFGPPPEDGEKSS